MVQIQTSDHVEVAASRPVRVLVVFLDHIQVNAAKGDAALLEQLTHAAKAAGKGVTLDGFVVGGHDGAIV